MTTLGLVSYSLYLWHIPVLWIAWWGLSDLPPAARGGIALATLVPAVHLSFRYLEKPWLKLPSSEEAHPVLVLVTPEAASPGTERSE